MFWMETLWIIYLTCTNYAEGDSNAHKDCIVYIFTDTVLVASSENIRCYDLMYVVESRWSTLQDHLKNGLVMFPDVEEK